MSELTLALDIPRRSTPTLGTSVSPSNSTTLPQQPKTPSALTPSSLTSNPFDFTVPSLPPRLSRVGRRISEIGLNVLVGPDIDDLTPPPSRPDSRASRRPPPPEIEEEEHDEVPGMGDEPVMCPFCNKPLPPSLIIHQMAHNHAQTSARRRNEMERKTSLRRSADGQRQLGLRKVVEGQEAGGVAMSSTASAPVSAIQSRNPSLSAGTGPSTSILPGNSAFGSKSTDALVESTAFKPGEDVPKATAESLLPAVKSAETVDIAGAASIISPDQVRRWSVVAGIQLPGSKVPAPGPLAPPAQIEEKAIPAIPPPPPPASRTGVSEKASTPSSRFGGIFRGGSKAEEEESDDDEDGFAGTGGYAKLSGPASPERVEKPLLTDRKEEKKGDVMVRKEEDGSEGSSEIDKKDVVPVQTSDPAAPAKTGAQSDAELRKLLTEVLGKVDTMSKAHEELLTSHTTLLTSLKIARSNLAMAEANSEMLEEQLKRVPPAPAPALARPPSTKPSLTPISAITSQAPPPPPPSTPAQAPKPSVPPTIVTPVRKSLDETRPPVPRSDVPRRSEDTRRPMSMVMPPPNLYNTGPTTGPASSRASTESKGMFGFLGGKTKLPGGLGTINIPSAKELQASAARFGDSIAGPSRPATPSREHGQFFDYHVPATYAPVQNQTQSQNRSVSGPERPSGSRAPSPSGASVTARNSPTTSLLSPPSATSGTPTSPIVPQRPTPISPAVANELSKLRQAYLGSQTKIEAMAKELTELKKGKIEMEAELESLSQALFEEANKMVSEERRRRAELEESLKEVKEEREALRQTIKVLGGGGASEGDKASIKAEGEGNKEEDDDDDDQKDDWRPRDLDKHYEALRKTIHHVADGTAPTEAFSTATAGEGGRSSTESVAAMEIFPVNPRVTMSPSLDLGRRRNEEVNPWAEVDFGGGGGGGGGTISLGKAVRTMPEESTDPLAPAEATRAGAAQEGGVGTGAGAGALELDLTERDQVEERDSARGRRRSMTG